MEDAEFKKLTDEYVSCMSDVAAQLLRYVSMSLGLDAEYLEERFAEEPIQYCGINMYPPFDKNDNDSAYGVGAHTDLGFLTLLQQDHHGGLEIFDIVQDKWVEVPPLEDYFVINIGDMLEKWTHGIFIATLHRVNNKNFNDMRISLPFFYEWHVF